MDFFDAYDAALTPLFTASNVLNLVAGADAAGLLDALRETTAVEDLASATGQDVTTVRAICDALTATGVTCRDGERFRLSEPWSALADGAAFVPLGIALAGNAVEGRLLRGLAGNTYWSMPSEDRLVYARSISPDPYSDELVAGFAAQIAADPDRAAMLEGGRLLELGCGVAGRVLATLRAAPALTAVGVELSEDLAAEARRRAEELGVADRFTVVCADAAEFRTEEPFDFGFWSQFFFPAEARPGALAAMRAALRPGAPVDAPLGADHEAEAADPTGPAGQEYAIGRAILTSWGVPDRTPTSLTAELEEAGFTGVRVVPRAGSPAVRGFRP